MPDVRKLTVPVWLVALPVTVKPPVPLKVTLDLPLAGCKVTATDLDTGEVKDAQLAGKGELDLGTSGHDWVVVWKGK